MDDDGRRHDQSAGRRQLEGELTRRRRLFFGSRGQNLCTMDGRRRFPIRPPGPP